MNSGILRTKLNYTTHETAAYLASCCEYSATASAKGPVVDRIDYRDPDLVSVLVNVFPVQPGEE